MIQRPVFATHKQQLLFQNSGFGQYRPRGTGPNIIWNWHLFNYSMHLYDEADRDGASIITTFGITHNGMLDHMVIACQEPQWHI